MVSNKEIRETKNHLALPLSNESAKNKRNNLLKSVVGASVIATGLFMMPQATFAQVAEQPPAIVQKEAVAAPSASTSEDSSEAPAAGEEAPVASGEKKAEATDAVAVDNGASASDAQATEAKAPEAQATETHAPKAASAESDTTTDAGIDISEEQPAAAQKAGAEASTEPNYSEEEKNIKDYSDSERYKETDLKPGSTIVENVVTDEGKEKDGFKFDTKNPSPTSPSKTEYGYEIVIDKKTGQRTYTKIVVTDSGLVPVKAGDKPMMGEGEKLTPDSPDVTYKPDEDGDISGKRQKLYNYEASEETLKHINSKDNDTTVIGMKDNYTKDNPPKKYFDESFAITYKVNPWPNENDKLQLMKLNGEYNKKVFVQGQDINTGVKVDNIDANAKDRLVGQVYNPITGAIVPGASAYIGDDGNIHIQMPEGALTKDKSGKTVINEGSIFNTPDYKGIQNLDVKFFARPRTLEEFKAIAETPDKNGEKGTYTETGAGSDIINHKGTDVKIDKQGIDRYDHYNLIGKLKINLDDTRYYDQKFVDKKGNDTGEDTSIGVQPGKSFTVKMDKPEGSGDSYKTAEEMNEAAGRGEAAGELIMDFINRENAGKKEKDQWKVDVNPKDIANFTITPPKSAKAGDFIAIPVEYTYTNGSKDTKWFHFVVQESNYIKPEYGTEVNFPVNKQTSPATVKEDGKRIKPDHYSLPDTLETDAEGNKRATDDNGNKWTVSVDEKTGKVSAQPVDPKAFNGGEKLTVPVISHYVDKQKPGKDITEETEAYFVIKERANMTARYNAKAGKAGDELSSDVILNTEDHYNRKPGKYTLESDTFVDDKGNTWNVSIDEKTGKVTATVPEGVSNDKLDGALLNVPVVAHYFEEDGTLEVGTKKTEVQFVATGADLNSPEYNVSIGDGNSEMKSSVVINADDKKQSPSSYTIDETRTYTDDKGNEWTVSVDKTTGEVKATPKNPSALKGGEKLQVPVTAHYGEGETAPTHKTTAEFVVKDKEYASPDYDAKVVKPGESQSSDVKLPTDDSLKKPTKYTLDSTEFKDDKGNDWTVSIDETSGKVTATSPTGKKIDGAVLNVPVTAHYEDATGKEVTKKAAVQFIGSGTEGSYEYTETKPFETKVEVVKDLAPGEWRYKVVDGKEQKGENGSVTYKVTIKDSKVEGEPETVKTVEPVNAIIEIGNADYTGTVTHTEKIETPFEVEYQYSDELEAGQSKTIQTGEKGSYDLVYSQKIKNGQADGDATTSKENEKAPKKEIIVIGIKPVEKVEETPFDTEYIYDDTMDAGKTEEVTPGVNGKVITTTSYDQDKKELVSKEETEAPTNRVVKVGIKPVTKEVEADYKTRIEYDPNLEAGKVEKTEGEKGKTKITTSYDKDKNELVTNEKVLKEPKDEVIKIGTKAAENTTEVSKEVGTKIEYIYDDTLELGEVILGDFTPGKVETKVVQKYDPKTGKITAEEKTTVTPGVQKIVVGTKKTDNTCPMPDPTDPTDPTNPKDPSKPGESNPSKPDESNPSKPGESNPSKPGENNPSKPGENNPSKPGKNDPSKPGENDPSKPSENNPSKPGENNPSKPGENNPSKPGENNLSKPGESNPGKPGENNPGEPSKENPSKPADPNSTTSTESESSAPSRRTEADEAVDRTKAEKAASETARAKGDAKAPQTFDPGIAAPTGLAALASGLLVGLERLKRRKRD